MYRVEQILWRGNVGCTDAIHIDLNVALCAPGKSNGALVHVNAGNAVQQRLRIERVPAFDLLSEDEVASLGGGAPIRIFVTRRNADRLPSDTDFDKAFCQACESQRERCSVGDTETEVFGMRVVAEPQNLNVILACGQRFEPESSLRIRHGACPTLHAHCGSDYGNGRV